MSLSARPPRVARPATLRAALRAAASPTQPAAGAQAARSTVALDRAPRGAHADHAPTPTPTRPRRPSRLAAFARHGRDAQHRNASYLMLNGVTGAGAGLLFWLLLARILAVPAATLGIGASIVGIGTIVAVVAKGGLDTALLRHAPSTSGAGSRSLLRTAILLSSAAAVALAAVAATFAYATGGLSQLTPLDWLLVAGIGAALATSWLQDAHFLAEGDARRSFQRNLVLNAARLALPIPIVILAWPQPVALAWGIAIAASTVAGAGLGRALAPRTGTAPDRRAFLATSTRNLSGSAAEFLPGLLLAPLVLAVSGAEAAAAFTLAWTAASLLMLASAAVSRSALAELVRGGPAAHPTVLRKAVLMQLAVVAPAAILGMAIAPQAMGIFGDNYAAQASAAFVVLCASAFAVAPAYLYLSVLRARDRTAPLVAFPLAMAAALLLLAPPLATSLGVTGVAFAWLLSNLPFGLYAAWRLRQIMDEAPLPCASLVAEHEAEVVCVA